jgi:hypothetical protein
VREYIYSSVQQSFSDVFSDILLCIFFLEIFSHLLMLLLHVEYSPCGLGVFMNRVWSTRQITTISWKVMHGKVVPHMYVEYRRKRLDMCGTTFPCITFHDIVVICLVLHTLSAFAYILHVATTSISERISLGKRCIKEYLRRHLKRTMHLFPRDILSLIDVVATCRI